MRNLGPSNTCPRCVLITDLIQICALFPSVKVKKNVRQMEDKRKATITLIVAGIIILLVSLLADPVGIGSSSSTFGSLQMAGTVAGAIVTLLGLMLARRQ